MKTKKNKLLLATIIVTYIVMVLSLITIIALAFNLLGVTDFIEEYMMTFASGEDISSMLTMYYFELGIAILVNIYAVKNYMKIYKYRLNNKEAGRYITSVAIWQLLFCSFLPGLLGLIAGIKMTNRKVQVETTTQHPYISDYKLSAMAEAVERLKELRNKGAISEEEYYASLNKVLEG